MNPMEDAKRDTMKFPFRKNFQNGCSGKWKKQIGAEKQRMPLCGSGEDICMAGRKALRLRPLPWRFL